MRILNVALAFGMIAGLTACGAKDNKKDNNQEAAAPYTDEEKQKLEEDFANIPAAAVVRVPVDANGETIGDPEMKTISSADGLDSADGIAAAFESGAAPQKMGAAEELDADSSTQSWSQWDYYGQQGGGYGYGGGYGGGYGNGCTVNVGCGNVWGHNYWYNNYRPVLYTGGNTWNYGIYRPSYYVKSGYRYYCYRTKRYW